MKKFALLFLIIFLAQTAFAQRVRPRVPRKPNAAKNLAAKKLAEKEAFDQAVAQTDAAERINSLQKFAADFPKSKENIRAAELLVSTRAAYADEKMQAGETENGIELFKLAVINAPKPVSDKLFTEVLVRIPNSLLVRGQTAAAIETARLVEEKADGNARQTLAVAGFYLSLENAPEARRLAEKSLTLEPNLPAAYRTLGLANRLDFALEDSVNAYQKALDLEADSVVSKRSLAEMKRAVGKPSEAVALYREILAKDETDAAARTGLILALFDGENKAEAESEMEKSLEQNANNLPLLVGAAYWYAAHDDGAKAVELAERAVIVEPRYTWAHIALARGLTAQKRLLDAEKTLLTARSYGNFPTLEYELAAVRIQSGFYREAAEGLAKSFTTRNGLISTKLGGRVSSEAKNFIELLSAERRAAIFQPLAADNAEAADRLKSLLDFYQKVEAAPNDDTIIAKADEFIKGDDKMKLHRQLFVANRLLGKKSNPAKVSELTKLAIGGVDAGLSVENPAAAVLAEELYESRQTAVSRGQIVLVPEVSRQTLSNILRGRIEDTAGWALFQEGKPGDAAVRLKRAVSILPEKSSWWRDSQWRLGTALEFDGKLKDALEAYVKSYTNGEPNAAKYSVVQSIYQRVNGSADGLESKIGVKPAFVTAQVPIQTVPTIAPETTQTETIPTAEPSSEIAAKITKQYPPSPTTAKSPTETAPIQLTPPGIETAPTADTIIEETKVEEIPIEKAAPMPAVKEEIAPAPETKISKTVLAETKSGVGSELPETKEFKTLKPPTAEPAPPSLFEPVIITVPKAEPITLKTATEKNEATDSGANRPRIIVQKEPETPLPTCEIIPAQSEISVINNGGTLALVVELVGEGDPKEIKAASSSASDVQAVYDGEISGQLKRALFVIKSVSSKKGRYLISFETTCGASEILVRVR